MLAFAVAGCGSDDTSSTEKPLQVAAVQVAAEQMSTIKRSFPVTVLRERESKLSARVGGVLSAVQVEAGQRLRSGSLVAAIRSDGFGAERARILAVRNNLRLTVSRQQQLFDIGAISKSELERSQSELRANEASLTAANFELRSTQVRMPFDGIVLGVEAEVGEVVMPGQTITKVADVSSPLIARAMIPGEVARQFRRGQVMQIRLPGEANPLSARLMRIGLSNDPRTATVDVDFALPSAARRLASGTVGSVDVVLESEGNNKASQQLPIEALLEINDDVAYVYVVDSKTKKARRTKATLIGIENDWLRVCCLPAGSVIITDGAGFVKNGEVVAPVLQ